VNSPREPIAALMPFTSVSRTPCGGRGHM
jgi:hypothetical protein